MFYSRQAWVNGTQENEVKEWVDLTRFDVNENKTMVRDSGATERLGSHETFILGRHAAAGEHQGVRLPP